MGCFGDRRYLTLLCRVAVGPRIDRTNLKMTKTRATKQVSFDVNIKGEPAPKVKWYFKDEEVSGLALKRVRHIQEGLARALLWLPVCNLTNNLANDYQTLLRYEG